MSSPKSARHTAYGIYYHSTEEYLATNGSRTKDLRKARKYKTIKLAYAELARRGLEDTSAVVIDIPAGNPWAGKRS